MGFNCFSVLSWEAEIQALDTFEQKEHTNRAIYRVSLSTLLKSVVI